MASAVAVIICGHRGQCVPVWVVALLRIKRLVKEAIETPSSPIAMVQETGQLVSIHCPHQSVEDRISRQSENITWLNYVVVQHQAPLLSRFALGTIVGRTFLQLSYLSLTLSLGSKPFLLQSGGCREGKPRLLWLLIYFIWSTGWVFMLGTILSHG